jgi:hypothetical protein
VAISTDGFGGSGTAAGDIGDWVAAGAAIEAVIRAISPAAREFCGAVAVGVAGAAGGAGCGGGSGTGVGIACCAATFANQRGGGGCGGVAGGGGGALAASSPDRRRNTALSGVRFSVDRRGGTVCGWFEFTSTEILVDRSFGGPEFLLSGALWCSYCYLKADETEAHHNGSRGTRHLGFTAVVRRVRLPPTPLS